MIRIAILADSGARVQSLAEMLEEDDRLEVTTWNGAGRTSADVILAVDIPPARLPDEGTPVVALGGPTAQVNFSETLRAALPINSSDAEIVAALVAAANNLTVLTASQARRLHTQSSYDEENSVAEALTPREMEVFQMMSAGLGNKEIANRLGMSSHTAKFHVAQIMSKLYAVSRTEAVSIGIRRGLITI